MANEAAKQATVETQASRGAVPDIDPGCAFTIRGLSFSYGEKVVFESLDAAFREGIVTTIIGANGSGKTTLFNLMTKNLKPAGGTIHLRGGDVTALRLRDFARLVAIVHQHNIAPADIPVRRLVGYGRTPHHGFGRMARTDEDERMIAWALETTGLSDLADAPVSSLSGGQRQRAWIAMSLAQGTKVLLLDEPTTYLDVRYQLEILHLVRDLNVKSGMTVIMVLHDINQSLHYSDEVVALAGGRMVAQGPPDDIVTPELVRQVYGVDLEIERIRDKPFVLAV